MNDKQPEAPPDPVELVVKAVPQQLWVAIGAVAAMLLASWLFFKAPSPEMGAAATGETLEGRVVEVLAEEQLRVAEQSQPVQRVLIQITRGSLKGQRIELLHGQATALTADTRVQPGDRV